MAQLDADGRAYVLGGDVALLSTGDGIGEERFYSCPVAEAARPEVRRVIAIRRRLQAGDGLQEQLDGDRPSKVLRDAIDLVDVELAQLHDAQRQLLKERAEAEAEAKRRAGGDHG